MTLDSKQTLQHSSCSTSSFAWHQPALQYHKFSKGIFSIPLPWLIARIIHLFLPIQTLQNMFLICSESSFMLVGMPAKLTAAVPRYFT
jgi:hypothetical protein